MPATCDEQTRECPAHTVALLDDVPEVRAAVSVLLRHWLPDVRIIEYGHAEVLLESLLSRPIDLLITDWTHPGPTGDDFLARLLATNWKCPIVVLSAAGSMHSPRPRFDPVIDPDVVWMDKPFDATNLIRVVRDLLGIHSE